MSKRAKTEAARLLGVPLLGGIVEHVDEFVRDGRLMAREQRELVLQEIQPAIERHDDRQGRGVARAPNAITS